MRARRQRGAALLLAMLILTLVATLAAGMVWQQQRAVNVEAAERARVQAAWILNGALDWARLILREDGRSGGVDHLGEPWATPLAEGRLSAFLAVDRDNNTDSGPDAFLSGAIVDAQSRYNLRNVVGPDGKVPKDEMATLAKLCDMAGAPSDTASRLAESLRAAYAPPSNEAVDTTAPLAPTRVSELVWLGLDGATITRLQPFVEVLPVRGTALNLNTASGEVIAAVLNVDLGTAERLVQSRQRNPFSTVDEVKPQLPGDFKLDPARVSVGSSWFEVSGRLRLDDRILEERTLLQRTGQGAANVVAVRRERRSSLGGQP